MALSDHGVESCVLVSCEAKRESAHRASIFCVLSPPTTFSPRPSSRPHYPIAKSGNTIIYHALRLAYTRNPTPEQTSTLDHNSGQTPRQRPPSPHPPSRHCYRSCPRSANMHAMFEISSLRSSGQAKSFVWGCSDCKPALSSYGISRRHGWLNVLRSGLPSAGRVPSEGHTPNPRGRRHFIRIFCAWNFL
jgi:hypothetical protein